MLLDELLSASIYRNLASMYKRKSVIEKLLRMADMETRHAKFRANIGFILKLLELGGREAIKYMLH